MTMPLAAHDDRLAINRSEASSAWWARPIRSAENVEIHEERQGPVAFAGMVAFTFILLLSPQNWVPALKPLRIAFLAAGFATASLLWERWRDRKALGITSEMVTCLALLAWTFMTVPLSYWPGGSVATLTDLYIKSVIVFWLLANVITTTRRVKLLAIVLTLCTVPLAATGLKNFITGTFVNDDEVARIVGYDAGLSANPNDLALMLNLLLPLCFAVFLSAKKTSVRAVCVTIIIINVVGIIVTFSRAGFLGLATIGVVYFVRMIRRPGADRGWAFGLAILALSALPLLPSNYVERVATVTDIESDRTGSSQIRWRDTVAAAQYVMEHPIVGAGLGMDVIALNQVRGEFWYAVHNVYLQYAVDLGLPGIALFLTLFYGVFNATRSSRRRAANVPALRDLFLLIEAVQVSLIVFAVAGFFYPVAYHFYFYYIAGLALALRAVTYRASDVVTISGNHQLLPRLV